MTFDFVNFCEDCFNAVSSSLHRLIHQQDADRVKQVPINQLLYIYIYISIVICIDISLLYIIICININLYYVTEESQMN